MCWTVLSLCKLSTHASFQAKRFVFQGTHENAQCSGGSKAAETEVEMTNRTLEPQLPGRNDSSGRKRSQSLEMEEESDAELFSLCVIHLAGGARGRQQT